MVSVLISVSNQGTVTTLVLLDLSSAFDYVNHNIIIQVLKDRFPVQGQALARLLSYLNDFSQIFRVGGCDSAPFQSTAVSHKDLA